MKKTISITGWLSLIFFGLAVSLLVAFNLIGSTVDAQGFLYEPFALIPLAWLCVAFGMLSGATHIITRIIHTINKPQNAQ